MESGIDWRQTARENRCKSDPMGTDWNEGTRREEQGVTWRDGNRRKKETQIQETQLIQAFFFLFWMSFKNDTKTVAEKTGSKLFF